MLNSKKILQYARRNQFAIPAVNFIDFNSARAYVQVAEKKSLPLSLAYAQSHREFLSLEEAALIGKYFAKNAKVPVVLHLDHGEDKETIFKAIDLGFSSVMIDASTETFEKNIALSREVVDFAHQRDVTVEAELGHVGSNDRSEVLKSTDSKYTKAEDVLEFVQRTNVDSLAVSIGTAHGLYKGEPHINFERLKEIANVCTIPLVLHGGSSSGEENLRKCAKNGIAKINIYTDFIVAAYHAILQNKPEGYISMKCEADTAMKHVLENYYRVFDTKSVKIEEIE